MVTTLSVTSDFNVAATLNADFEAFVRALVVPWWFGDFADPPVQMISDKFEPDVPVFSITHIGVSSEYAYEGNQGSAANTTRDTALMDISGWVSRRNGNNAVWTGQLRVMGDVIKQWAKQHSEIVIKEYLYDPRNPTATDALVRLAEARPRDSEHDPNKDIERVRVLVPYWWDYRG